MVTHEDDARLLAARLDDHNDRLYCALGAWEATLAIARKRTVTVEEAEGALERLIRQLGLRSVSIGEQEGQLAVEAHARYGMGRHPARLNMGDCFAYACAKTNDARLLYKGDDFLHTDLA
jgi:ribonuclease VapC